MTNFDLKLMERYEKTKNAIHDHFKKSTVPLQMVNLGNLVFTDNIRNVFIEKFMELLQQKIQASHFGF